MTYKNEEIGIPCPEMVKEYIDECGLSISAEEVIEYWKPKDFLTKKGHPVKTLEALVHVTNSIYVQKMRKISTNGATSSDAEKWLRRNFNAFCECMNQLKDKNPQKWQELYHELVMNICH